MSGRHVNITLGTAGHVDHGKTALVRMLTGCETDRLKEEKQRGLTIELGFAPCHLNNDRIVGVVDVPGHVDFIRNMVAGAHGIDVVILVIAADDSVMPQTREHLDILTLMGTRHGLVALTKIDLVSAELRDAAVEEVRGLVRGTFLEGAPVCPVSNVTFEGYEAFFKALNEVVDAVEPESTEGLFRVWIERVFTIKGFGTIVTGIPTSGEVRTGDRLRIVPGGQTGRVRSLQVYGRDAEVGRAGECVALNVADVDAVGIERGLVACADDACEPVAMAEAELTVLPAATGPLQDYAEVHVHVGTAETVANVAVLDAKDIAPGEARLVQLRMKGRLGVVPGDRFVIRGTMAGMADGRVTTLGGGRIIGTSDVRLRRGRPWTLERLERRRRAIDLPAEWVAVQLAEAGEPVTVEEAARRARMEPWRAGEILTSLAASGRAHRLGGAFVHDDAVVSAAALAREALGRFHEANPARLGLDEAALADETRASPAVLRLALERLQREGALERRGDVFALTGRAPASPEEGGLRDEVEAAWREAGFAPPDAESAAEALGSDPARVREAVDRLVDEGVLVRLDERIVMHAEAVEAAREVALDLFRKARSFTTVEFRDALGVSRKYAVPLLDWFDQARWTVRMANKRTPGSEAKKRLAAG